MKDVKLFDCLQNLISSGGGGGGGSGSGGGSFCCGSCGSCSV